MAKKRKFLYTKKYCIKFYTKKAIFLSLHFRFVSLTLRSRPLWTRSGRTLFGFLTLRSRPLRTCSGRTLFGFLSNISFQILDFRTDNLRVHIFFWVQMNFRLKIFVHLTRSLTSFQEISTISTSEQIRPFFRILNFLDRFFQSSFEHNQKILGVIFFRSLTSFQEISKYEFSIENFCAFWHEVLPVSKRSARRRLVSEG